VLYGSAPIKPPTKAPVTAPILPPTKAPVTAPIKPPTKAPVLAPITPPTKAPVLAPIKPPTKAPVPTTTETIVHRINCGSANQVAVPPNNIVWTPDQYSSAGVLFNTCGNITNSIYCTSRFFRTSNAAPYRYNLPVTSNRTYTVRLHFAEQVRLMLIVFPCEFLCRIDGLLIHFLFGCLQCSTLQQRMHVNSTFS
jgi:Malectin domain